jgi:hypothetical protein
MKAIRGPTKNSRSRAFPRHPPQYTHDGFFFSSDNHEVDETKSIVESMTLRHLIGLSLLVGFGTSDNNLPVAMSSSTYQHFRN